MLDALADDIHYLILKHQADTDMESGLRNGTWEAVCHLLSRHKRVADKRNAERLLPVKLKPRDQWTLSRQRAGSTPSYRNDQNIEAVTVLVMDLDVPGAKEKATAFFKDFDYILHSTYSYSPEAPYKFRMAVRLQEPVPKEEWRGIYDAIASQVDADSQCGNPSRVYSLPTAPTGGTVSPVVERNHGARGGLSLQLLRSWATAYETRRAKTSQADRTHFSGEAVEVTPGEVAIPYSYNALKNRHKTALDTLQNDDSRHFFALRVARGEISRFGAKTNVPLLIEFIYRAALDYSSKPITAGNTGEELPDIIESAFLKYSEENYDPVALQRQISSAMEAAVNAQTSDVWQMDLQRWHASAKAGATFKAMEERYKTHTLGYQSGQLSAAGFFAAVLGQDAPDSLLSRAQYCAFVAARHFSRQGKQLSEEAITVVADHCSSQAADLPAEIFPGTCPREVQVKSAVLLAAKAATGKMEFMVSPDVTPNNNEYAPCAGEPA